MITTQARGGPQPSPVFSINDLKTSEKSEPRVYDLTLAAKLGFEHARNIRRLIKSHRAELQTHGRLAAVEDRTGGIGDTGDNLLLAGAKSPKQGRPGEAFYLNEGQALVICALTRTPAGAKVRSELIRVFQLHRCREQQSFRDGRYEPLRRAERRCLEAIVQHADVVMAPPMHGIPHRDLDHGYLVRGIDVVGSETDTGHIPYILAPITHGILEILAEFEADEADYEDTGDYEPSIGGSSGYDLEEDKSNDEPSHGSLANRHDQTAWGAGAGTSDDREQQCEDEGAQCDDEGYQDP